MKPTIAVTTHKNSMHKNGHKQQAQRQPLQPAKSPVNFTGQFMSGYLQSKGVPTQEAEKTAYNVSTKPENRLR